MSRRHPSCQVSSSRGTGMAARSAAYNETYKKTKNHKAAVAASTAGHKWSTENAKATGNL